MTSARKSLFQDSVELQRLTLTQVTHKFLIRNLAENPIFIPVSRLTKYIDHSQLPQEYSGLWTYDHSRWIANRIEIEEFVKGAEHAVSATSKSTYEYGCQLLKAALSLRQSCKFLEDHTQSLKSCLNKAWDQLNSVGQEQLTRLRVSAVFYRNVKEQCNQLHELMDLAKCESLGSSRGKVRKLLANRERLLLEIGRMVRLGRLLKTRLREPLSSETTIDDMNETAVEAISEKLAEIALLAESLDKILCTNDVIKTQEKGSEISEWYSDSTSKVDKATGASTDLDE
ncbi:uncharacterized protein LOC103516554 [Diaphorina citri]|uniref:Uncharacterized protein LOC103516554 n=1 Tax=Diaphorina citri TaxID=121845 RepID=A0A1S4EKF2_DIACI|nr:uncharacterized protein LOC103516554 [Diaphorina citri]